MDAHCAEHSHSWLYIRPAGYHATPGHGGKVDHFAIGDHFRFLVMEGAFAAEAVEEGVVLSWN
jgi:hypothetical protein